MRSRRSGGCFRIWLESKHKIDRRAYCLATKMAGKQFTLHRKQKGRSLVTVVKKWECV
jgi:hypothetical protein